MQFVAITDETIGKRNFRGAWLTFMDVDKPTFDYIRKPDSETGHVAFERCYVPRRLFIGCVVGSL